MKNWENMEPDIRTFLDNPTPEELLRYQGRADWAMDAAQSFLWHGRWLSKDIAERYPLDVLLCGLYLACHLIKDTIYEQMLEKDGDAGSASDFLASLEEWAEERYLDQIED